MRSARVFFSSLCKAEESAAAQAQADAAKEAGDQGEDVEDPASKMSDDPVFAKMQFRLKLEPCLQ